MDLSHETIQALKEIQSFASVKRYHGMMPEKQAMLYESEVIEYLKVNNLVEEGVIFSKCGTSTRGYRVADQARALLKEYGLDLEADGWETINRFGFISEEGLEPGHMDILRDMDRITRVKVFGGLVPKHVMDEFDKRRVKTLYEGGYIFYIKIKGADVKYTKGYILSEKGTYLVRHLGPGEALGPARPRAGQACPASTDGGNDS